LEATRQLHPQFFAETVREKLGHILQGVQNNDFGLVIKILVYVPHAFESLPKDSQGRIEQYVLNLPDLNYLPELLDFSGLESQARSRLKSASIDELNKCVYFFLHDLIAEKYIENYLDSKTFAQANVRSGRLKAYASDFSAAQQRRILAGIDTNEQLRGSFEAGPLISKLRETNKIETDEFDAILKSFKLEDLL
jgi:hypothetical protein